MTSSPPTASTTAAAQNAVAPRPRGPTRAQQLNKLYALPTPLRTYPLPTLVPHNPLSLFHVIYTWISQTYSQPKSHPETLYQGWFSPETRSVHVTDPRSSRALWEQGFYGKGNLSRSEPSWHDREKRRKGAKASQTSEEVTRARRAERQQVKWERARKEREAIDQTLSEERKQSEAPAEQDGFPTTHSIRDSAIDMSSVAVEAMIPTMDAVVSEVEQILSSEEVATEELPVPAEPIRSVDIAPEPQPEDLEDATPVETVTAIEESTPAVAEPAETTDAVEDSAPAMYEPLATTAVIEEAIPAADESSEIIAIVEETTPVAEEPAETIAIVGETMLVDEPVAEAAHKEQSYIELPNDSLLAEEPEQSAADEVQSASQDITTEQEVEDMVVEKESEQSTSSLPATKTNIELPVIEEIVVDNVDHDDREPEPVSNEPSVADEPEPDMTEVDPLTASTVLSEELAAEVADETAVDPELVTNASLPEATLETTPEIVSEAIPESIPEVAAEEPIPTHSYEFNAAPVLATEIVETIEHVAPVKEIPGPSPLVRIFMAACEKRGCPIIPQYAAQVLKEHESKLVPAVLTVTRNYDPAIMNVVQIVSLPLTKPEVEVKVEAEPEIETTTKPEVLPSPSSPATGPLELLLLPNSLDDLGDDSTAVESTKSADEFDEHVSVVGSHGDSQEDSFVKDVVVETYLAPTGPLELLALPNSAPGTVYPSLDDNKLLEVAGILEDEVVIGENRLTTEDIAAVTEAVETTKTAMGAGEAIQESVEAADDIQDEDVKVAAEVTDVAAEAVEAVEMAIETIVQSPTPSNESRDPVLVDEVQDQDSKAPLSTEDFQEAEAIVYVETEDTTQDVEARSANSGTPEEVAVIDEATEDQADCEQTTPLASDSVDMVQEEQSASVEIPSTEIDVTPSSPKSPKTVRFSPKIEETTFIKESAPSPELAVAISEVDDVSAPESDVAIVDKEHLQLTLEETFFLAYGLGVLTVYDPETKQPMTIPELFDVCRAASYYPPLEQPISGPDDPFLLNYVVYHHFRSLGWVVRGGTKFSVDFLLYNRGPPFSHAEFAVVVIPSYSDPYWTQDEALRAVIAEKESRSWHWLHCINRVNSQVKKTVVLVYVDIPPPAPEPVEDTMGIDNMLKRYKIRELVMKRWLSNRSRD